MQLKKGELIGEKEVYYNDEIAFIIKNFGEDGYDVWQFNYDKEQKKWIRQANPLDCVVSFAEPNQQLFTIAEVNEFLQEQRRICADHVLAKLDSQEKTTLGFDRVLSKEILEIYPPQKFIDRIIVKS